MRQVSITVRRAPGILRALPVPTPGTLIIVLVAALAMTPELAIGLSVTDNFRFNLNWPQQFVELFRSGHLYPRWLPHSWHGLGSPVFYFYPPLFFWVTSVIDAVTGGTLASERLVPLASLILLMGSGLSMRAWLRVHSGERRAVIGAIAFVLAPFHLYHLYGTGALAEGSTYASVPLVMLALARLGDGRKGSVPMLAAAYAALLFSHLPTSLLVTLFLIAPYVAFIAYRSANPARFVMVAYAGGAIGVMLAAIFIIPAFALLPQVSPSALSGSFYRPENWFFWHIRAGIIAGRMLFLIPISIAALLFAIGTTFAVRAKQSRSEPLFWAILTMFLVALIAGLIPVIWTLPGLALVQFPWRALLLVEFTTVTLLVIGAPSLKNLFVLAGVPALVFAYVALVLIATHVVGRTWNGLQRAAADIRADYWDAPEYLPDGTRIDQGDGPDDVSIVLPRMPLASADDPQAKIEVSEDADGGMFVAVEARKPTRLAVRRFYFPHWQLRDAADRQVPISAEPYSRVVSFQAPAGRSTFRLRPSIAPYEMLGRTISLLALILLAILIAGNLLMHRWRLRAG